MKNNNLRAVILALGWGAILAGGAGFAAGLLLAPEDGRRMRRRISFKLDKMGRRVADACESIFARVDDKDARRDGDDLVADAMQKARALRTEMDAVLGQVKQQGSATPAGE